MVNSKDWPAYFGIDGAVDVILGQCRQRRIKCSDKVMLEFSFEKTNCAEDPRHRRDQYRPDFERASRLGGKKRIVAAESDQREVSRFPAAFDRNGTHRTRNAGAVDEIGAVGRFLQWQTEGRGYLRENRAPRFGRIKRQPARQPVLREIAKRYIRIGQGRRGPAIAVANRARHRAGAAWADMQSSGHVDCKNTTAAGADLGDVDRRGTQKIPSTLVEPAATRDRAAHLKLARSPNL